MYFAGDAPGVWDTESVVTRHSDLVQTDGLQMIDSIHLLLK